MVVSRSAVLAALLLFHPWAGKAHAEARVHALLAVGEAPNRDYDMISSGPMPQAGLGLEYATRFAIPYVRAHAGVYNGLQADAGAGIALGLEIAGFRPSLTVGAGVETVVEKKYRGLDGEEEYLDRVGRTLASYGLRLDIGRFTADVEFRDMAIPFWRMGVGWRIF